jgi:hypothetical protein
VPDLHGAVEFGVRAGDAARTPEPGDELLHPLGQDSRDHDLGAGTQVARGDGGRQAVEGRREREDNFKRHILYSTTRPKLDHQTIIHHNAKRGR